MRCEGNCKENQKGYSLRELGNFLRSKKLLPFLKYFSSHRMLYSGSMYLQVTNQIAY